MAGFITNLPRFILEIIVITFATVTLIFLSLKNIPSSEIFLKASVFGFAAFRLLPSLNRIISSYEKFRVCKFQINTIYNQINLPSNLDYASNNKKKLINLNEFENLQNINFKYQDSSKYIFNDVSLKINKGEYIGIVGETGSGKSTLADLIIGLLKPIKGNVKVNDLDIKEYNGGTKIGYVPQFVCN